MPFVIPSYELQPRLLLGGNASRDEIEALADVVAAIPGVEDVANRLTIGARHAASGSTDAARH